MERRAVSLSTYPGLPATGHAEVDGISVVSVNGMMAMLRLPILTWHMQVGTNTFGGSLGTGRIHGLWHIIEGALQASGRAGSRQVKAVDNSVVGASAPILTGTTFIFVSDPY